MMKKSLLILGSGLLTQVLLQAAPFADAVLDYQPGAFGASGYLFPHAALGQPGQADSFGTPVDPFNPPWQTNQVVSIGAGGSLTVHLGAPIVNDPTHAYGVDFMVFGNAGFVVTNEMDQNWQYIGTPSTGGALFGSALGPIRVAVSTDGVNFYDLDPSLTPILDSMYPTDGAGDFQKPVNPALTPSSFVGKTLDDIRNLYVGSAGGTGFDLGWAQDSGGNPVNLTSASFVRISVLDDKAEIDGFAAVPEPTIVSLAVLGAGALCLHGRRRRQSGTAKRQPGTV